MMILFHRMSRQCGRTVTEEYSTSFASSVRLLHRDLRDHIYSIYGFVRIADEIVDTFHEHDKPALLTKFKEETRAAIRDGISLNPILNGFQLTVRECGIDESLIDAFFTSMEMDLYCQTHDTLSYHNYVYGSAEAVGLMCLRVFCSDDERLYHQLIPPARSLGAAFQKVNFLRDLGADRQDLNRSYFPGVGPSGLTELEKRNIEQEIAADFRHAAMGIARLPEKARLGVYVAYKYYLSLFKKIQQITPTRIVQQRIRIPNYQKWLILLRAGLKEQLNLL